MSLTVLQAIGKSLSEASKINTTNSEKPASLLWTDGDGQWKEVFSKLRAQSNNLLSHGAYEPDRNQGPAIWLKAAIGGHIPEVKIDGVPIIYFPAVSRSDLRAIESCPRDLQPLAELQYRGLFWSQTNGKDWTVNAFLTSSSGGLGLNVSQDKETQETLFQVIKAGLFLDLPVSALQGRQINAAWLNTLLAPNPTRDLLVWMNNPESTKLNWQGPKWNAFCKWAKKDFGFEPIADGELVAAEKLALRDGKWKAVYELFEDSYQNFHGVVALLKKLNAPGLDGLFPDWEVVQCFPSANIKFEDDLRGELNAAGELETEACRAAILKAEEFHKVRRGWLWAKMGEAELANSLLHLSNLAKLTQKLPFGSSSSEYAIVYQEWGWKVDDAMIKALASISSSADRVAVSKVIRALYLPWATESANRLQTVVKAEQGFTSLSGGRPSESCKPGTCVIFVDGLRYDVGCNLAAQLESLGKVKVSAQWTSLPSVTASGKAWSAPVASKVSGTAEDVEFVPRDAETGKTLSSYNFKKLFENNCIRVLAKDETGNPTELAWTECGDLDHYGHEHGIRLAKDLGLQLRIIQERISELMTVGWKSFRIVTDHGWLLLPGGLPKVDLPKHQTETKWGRCAVLKETAQATNLTLGWDWCKDVQIAYPHGISSFKAGDEYSHGGISFQESLVPVIDLEIEGGQSLLLAVKIEEVEWRGLRCKITVSGDYSGLKADIRTKPALADSSIAAKQKDLEEGMASLAIPDDDMEGCAAVIVLVNAEGAVVQKRSTTVGEN